MGIINFFINLLKDPRTAIASWIPRSPRFIFLIVFVETGVVFSCSCRATPAVRRRLLRRARRPRCCLWSPIIGDQCNYWIGHFFGRRASNPAESRL